MKREDLTGTIINGKRVLGVAGRATDGYHTLYLVECPRCKNEYTAPKSNLLRTNTCFKCCSRTRKGTDHNRWEGGTIVPLDYYHSVERNARRRSITFSVSLKLIEDLYTAQNQKCILTGDFIDFVSGTASLDRIDNSKGYIEGNLQWVHKDVNLMKNKKSEREFINYCIKIHQYSHQPKPIGLLPEYPPCLHKNFKGIGYVPKDFYTALKKGAEQRKVEFLVSLEDLNKLFIAQSGRCNLTGESLFFRKHYKNGSFKKQGNASIDRIDNTKGYIPENIQWVDKMANMIKYKLTQDRFFDLCRRITKKFTVVVAISGYFQILHVGHINYINEARKLGGYLIVIINSDKQAKTKITPSVVNETDRSYIVSNIKGVDEVIIAVDEDGTVSKTLELVHPHIFCNGGDRNPETSASKETDTCEKLGIQMVYGVGGGKSDSSSGILQRAHEILTNTNKICCNSSSKDV